MSTGRMTAFLLAAMLLLSSCAGKEAAQTPPDSTVEQTDAASDSADVTSDTTEEQTDAVSDIPEDTGTAVPEAMSDSAEDTESTAPTVTSAALTEDEMKDIIDRNIEVIEGETDEYGFFVTESEADAIAAHPEEFERIVAFGEDALPYLSEIAKGYRNIGEDTSGNLRCFIAMAAVYAISPETFDFAITSPDGKLALRAAVSSFFGLTDPFSGISYNLCLVDTVTGETVADAGDTGFCFSGYDPSDMIHWSNDCRSAAVVQGYRHYYSDCYLFTADKPGFQKLPGKNDAVQFIGREIISYYDGTEVDFLHFCLPEWIDDRTLKINMVLSNNAGSYYHIGWYVFDLESGSIKKMFCGLSGVSENEMIYIYPEAGVKLTAVYPVIDGEDTGLINERLAEFVRGLYSGIAGCNPANAAEAPYAAGSLTACLKYETTRLDDEILSIRFTAQIAGEEMVQVDETGFNIDMKTGQLIDLYDLYPAEEVSAMIDAYFDALDVSEYPTLFSLYTPEELRADFHRKFDGTTDAVGSFYLTDDKLCLIAGCYDGYTFDTDLWAHGRSPFIAEIGIDEKTE